MRYKKIIIVAGTRPNFVKVAPLLKAFRALPKLERPKVWLLHTGQHYGHLMSKVFFEDLNMPKPDIFLNIKAQTPAGQTDEILDRFPKVLAAKKPELVVVVGDVTSTLACALAAKMSGIAVAHVEAGLRSYDPSMPEELNRVLTDHVSDLLFTSCPEAEGNLLKEGIAKKKIHFAGNVMIDSLRQVLGNRDQMMGAGAPKQPYVLLTLHRPGNVDDPKVLGPMLKAFEQIAREVAVVFPAHPRTLKYLKAYNLAGKLKNGKTCSENGRLAQQTNGSEIGSIKNGLQVIPPLGYLDFIALQQSAVCVFTDSGGVQEETSFLGVPCFTVRENTERPVTVELGTNQIIGTKPGAIIQAWSKIKRQPFGPAQGKNSKIKSTKRKTPNGKRQTGIPKWDGHAAERIVETIINEQ